MGIRRRIGLLIACCAGLAACTSSVQGPDVAVTAPAVGKPQPPASVEAALSSEAFTPYAALGLASDDGLAPRESSYSLGLACMTAAGYPNPPAGSVFTSINLGAAGLAFSQPWGEWGYLGTAEAQQSGFQAQPTQALASLGIDAQVGDQPSLPAAEQAAAMKCGTIAQNFSDATQSDQLAIIATLTDDIASDVRQDPAVKRAVQTWTACMTANGYSFGQPGTVFLTELQAMHGDKRPITPGSPVSPAAEKAQLAAAVSDAQCTQSADLAGIYFAVQTSYEQQLTSANQQALDAAVRRYRTAYASELKKLPAQLRTAKVQPFHATKGR